MLSEPINRIINILQNSEYCVGCVWSGSSARNLDLKGDLDLIVFCKPHDYHQRLIEMVSSVAPSSHSDVIHHTPFLQQMGRLISIYYSPDYISSIDVGVVGEHWWPLVRHEPFAKTLWARDDFPIIPYERSYSVERLQKTEFWICIWKIRKALSRNSASRSIEYLNRARRALLSDYLDKNGIFNYPDRPDHLLEYISNSDYQLLVDNFELPSDRNGIIKYASRLIDRSYKIMSFNTTEMRSIKLFHDELLSEMQ
ncbi:MAG: hypothetical protein JAZ11_02940 [Candidatus Thiodiazotropha lotti]|nr:hypothetical protein [Candidatus Thiodiazotropha lotti]